MLINFVWSDSGRSQYQVDNFEAIAGIGIVLYIKDARTLIPYTSIKSMHWREKEDGEDFLSKAKLSGF